MTVFDDVSGLSRRAVLKASGGALGLSVAGGARAAEDPEGEGGETGGPAEDCPDAELAPSMRPCGGGHSGEHGGGCADDHPATEAIRRAVRDTFETRYPTVGALIDDGFVPYFDITVPGEDGGVSHWLNPEFIGDDAVLDAATPESVLVDNETWRPLGVMFVATEDGDPVEPPAVYGDDSESDPCSPWHQHVGLPGRFAWWYYRQVYEGDYMEGEVPFPCATPCMMHVWAVPNSRGVYAHGAPPVEERPGPPSEGTGLSTDAASGEERLGWTALPNELVDRAKPDGLSEGMRRRPGGVFDG